MKFTFKAKIYIVGINPCVKVPKKVTSQLLVTRGYIPVKGTIEGHFFQQTLCPVKGEPYRLYVNGPMLKGANATTGDTVTFVIEQDTLERNKNVPMPPALKKKLEETKLKMVFDQLTPSRQKEVCRYLNTIKTEATLQKNIDKIIRALKGKANSPLLRVK